MDSEDLAGPNTDRYHFRRHVLAAGTSPGPYRRHPADRRSFVVLSGRVVVQTPGHDPVEHGPLTGWHAGPDATYRLHAAGPGPAVVLEAGSTVGRTTLVGSEPPPDPTGAGVLLPLSDHRVTKPWGFELWYTANLLDPPYALKQIHMTAGHRSSLQSHEFKAETNYVIEGEATVLNGGTAPADPVDPATLPRSVHSPGSGWSSPPRMLHRVVAERDYTAIEVSTPELDDVTRWQDDSGRGSGRIASEHGPGR